MAHPTKAAHKAVRFVSVAHAALSIHRPITARVRFPCFSDKCVCVMLMMLTQADTLATGCLCAVCLPSVLLMSPVTVYRLLPGGFRALPRTAAVPRYVDCKYDPKSTP